MHKKCRGFRLGLWFMLQNNNVSVCEKRTLCDFMHRHLHIFQGVKSFDALHIYVNRHRTIATQLVIIFHFYGIFFFRGLNCEKSLFFHHIFTVHLSCLELTYYPLKIQAKQFIWICLQFFFTLNAKKNKSNIIEMGMCFKVIGSRRGFTTIENCVK